MDLTIDKIVWNKLHIWVRKAQSHPKTREHWLDVKNGMVVLNPETIKEQLKEAKEMIDDAKNKDKDILVISDKTLIKDEVEEKAMENNIHFINYRVPSGVLTNFATLKKRIKVMNELEEFVKSDKYKKLTKKEQIIKTRELEKLKKIYNGVRNLKDKPDLAVVLDGKMLDSVVSEVDKLEMDSVIVASSDFDRWRREDGLVMSNVNSYKSLTFILEYLLS